MIHIVVCIYIWSDALRLKAPSKVCLSDQSKWTFKEMKKRSKNKNWLFYHVLKIFKWVQTKPKKKTRKPKISKENANKWETPDLKKKTKFQKKWKVSNFKK